MKAKERNTYAHIMRFWRKIEINIINKIYNKIIFYFSYFLDHTLQLPLVFLLHPFKLHSLHLLHLQ